MKLSGKRAGAGRSRLAAGLLLLAAWLLFSPARSEADISIGVTFGKDGLQDFQMAVSDYFRSSAKEFLEIRGRGISYQEVPVVLYLASRARVRPEVIIEMRLGGKSWFEISVHFRLSPSIFYVPLRAKVVGPPYGNAYGYYRNKPRRTWKTITLTDEDVVNLVNLKFLSEHHRVAADRVVEMRGAGKDFLVINEEIVRGKQEAAQAGKRFRF